MADPYEYITDEECCWNCGGEGFVDDCMEDTCCCLNPPCATSTCDVCDGKGWIDA